MTRKTHTKSRKGCLTCKKRHVKCDEERPNCNACGRLGLTCAWPATPSLSPGPSNSPTSPPSSMTGTPELAIADLQLLHFWATNTSLTVSSKDTQYVWQSSLVELGFRHPFLLHGILACAAVHKAGVFPAESQSLMIQSSSHMEVAISAIRHHIEVPDPATCVPLFGASGLLVVHSLGLAQVMTPTDPVGNLCHWMRLVQGQKVTVQQNWVRLLTSEVAPILLSVDRERKRTESEILQLKNLVDLKVPMDSELREPYMQAIEELDSVFANVHHHLRTGEMFSVAITLSWTATMPRVVLNLISERDQLALVILAYFAVLFKLQEASWWMRGWGNWTLNAVQSQLDPEFLQWTEWPTQQMRAN